MKRTLALLTVALLVALVAMPQYPAPMTKDKRDIVINTKIAEDAAAALGCSEHNVILYDTGPEVDNAGDACPTNVLPAFQFILMGDGEVACHYTLFTVGDGVEVTSYAETNGVAGLQTDGDPTGAHAADAFCTLP
ncbi:MAG: hypothetical protein ACPGQL_04875 [Thermoplasmatota archaeon]